LTYSFINRFENSKSIHYVSRNAIRDFFSHARSYVDHTHAASVGERALEIMKGRVKVRDAYHRPTGKDGLDFRPTSSFRSGWNIAAPSKTTAIISSPPINRCCGIRRR
jgi:hypothetical protein